MSAIKVVTCNFRSSETGTSILLHCVQTVISTIVIASRLFFFICTVFLDNKKINYRLQCIQCASTRLLSYPRGLLIDRDVACGDRCCCCWGVRGCLEADPWSAAWLPPHVALQAEDCFPTGHNTASVLLLDWPFGWMVGHWG